MSYIYNQTKHNELRKKLRARQSEPEKILWSKLRNRQLLNFKFRRQYGIESYVVDFCCPETRLAVEIDGDSHFNDKKDIEADRLRQRYIENLGFEFMRFTNKDVTENIEGVVEVIARRLKNNPLQLPL